MGPSSAPISPSTHVEVKINGFAAQELTVGLERVVVEQHRALPASCLVFLRDPDRDVLAQSGAKIGAELTVEAIALDGVSGTVFNGEITGLEAEFDGGGRRTIIRAYAHAHRLHRGRRTETYLKLSDSQIATKIARRAGLKVGKVDRTSGKHDWIAQSNVTDWQFLEARAQVIGYEVGVDDGKFFFRKPPEASRGPRPVDLDKPAQSEQLVLGKNLRSFRARITASEQAAEVQVRAWDPQRKQVVVGRKQPQQASSASVGQKPGDLARPFPRVVHAVVDLTMGVNERDTAATALAERIAGVHVEAEGLAEGNPHLVAGTTVGIGNVGQEFDGRYVLSSARHVFDSSGYATSFVVGGQQDRSLLGLIADGGNGQGGGAGKRIYGVVPGLVSDVKDPDKLGRVKVKLPWLADDYETHWARVTQAGAGNERGWVLLPEVDDEVLVAFEEGNLRRPYVLGGLFNGKDKPPRAAELVDGSKGAVKKRVLVSRKGHAVVLSDEDGKEAVEIVSADGKLSITLDQKQTRIAIMSKGEVTVNTDKNVTVNAKGDAQLKATGKLALEGRDVEMKATGTVKIQGPAGVQVKGSKIELN